jgi:hypothetical protein
VVDIEADDVGTHLRQPNGVRSALPAGCTGDQGDRAG